MRFALGTLPGLLALLACTPGCSIAPPPPVPVAPQELAQRSQLPVLAVTTYGSVLDSLSEEVVLEGLRAGRVAVTADLAEAVRSHFELPAAPPVLTVHAMLAAPAGSLFLVTLDSLDKRLKEVIVGGRSVFAGPREHPLLLFPEGTPFDTTELVRYHHTGVTAITRYLGYVLDRRGADHVMAHARGWFRPGYIVHVSNEVSGVEDCDYRGMHMRFATKWRDMALLRELGVDVVELTGNHNLDMGTAPYLATLAWYAQQGMRTYGGGADMEQASRPLKVDLPDGHRLGFVGYDGTCLPGKGCRDRSIGAKRYFRTDAERAIASLRADSLVRTVVATVQFREVDSPRPPEPQVQMAHELIEAGADIVVGSQAHEPQYVEFHKGGIIFHGLGNFLFDQLHRTSLRQGFFLSCWLYRGRMVQVAPRYTCMSMDLQPRGATPEEARAIASSILLPELLRP